MILAASVCTRAGKVLLSRQFQDLGAERVQELFSNFSKLSQQGSQHTTIESDEVRYVYEPLEDLFVVLVTDLASNILQDIRTLHVVAQCVAAQVRTPTETEIGESAFEIISAFDEIINNGYSENLTLAQVETFLEMESHAEKIQEIIERNKELEAAESRKQKAKELEMQRKLKHSFDGSSSPFVDLGVPPVSQPMSQPANPSPFQSASVPSALPKAKVAPRGKGLQLGKKKEEPSVNLPTFASASTPLAAAAAAPAAASVPAVPESSTTEVIVSEQLTIDASRNGDTRSARVAGTLQLFAGDRSKSTLKISTSTSGPQNAYKTNPKMDRGLFASDRVLALRNPAEAFPASNVLLLKWTLENIEAPLQFSVWVSQSPDAGFLSVTVEYELAADFVDTIENVNVHIPLPHPNAHIVDPSSVYDQSDDQIVWMIPTINSANSSGTFDFTAEADSEDAFFPLQASLSIISSSALGKVVVDAINTTEGEPVEFATQLSVAAEITIS